MHRPPRTKIKEKARHKASAVVLGGGSFKGAISKNPKGMLLVAGKPVSERALQACRESNVLEEIVFVGSSEVALKEKEKLVSPALERKAAFESAMKGILAVSKNNSILVLPGDLPFLSPGSVRSIVRKAAEVKADVYLPMVDSKLYKGSVFAERKRSPVEFSEGAFIPTGIVVLSPRVLAVEGLVKEAERLASFIKDKKVARAVHLLSKKFGFANVAKLSRSRLPWFIRSLLKPVSFKSFERQVSDKCGLKVRVGLHGFPELAFDVDNATHLFIAGEIAEKLSRESKEREWKELDKEKMSKEKKGK